MNLRGIKLLAALLLAIVNIAIAQETWFSYSSMHSPYDIEYYDGDIWGATEGGIFKFSLADSTFQLYTRADGLKGKDVYCLAVDSTGKVWGAGQDAVFNILDPQNDSFYCINSISGEAQKINEIVISGNTVYAAADNGVYELYYDSLFDDYFVKGGYHQFGGFQANVEAKSVFIHDGYLWVGCESGAARIDITIPNKQPASYWETFTVDDGLPYSTVAGFTELHDTLYAACRFSGIARFDSSSFTPIYAGIETKEIRTLEDTIYVATSLGVKRLEGDVFITIAEGTNTCLSVMKTPEGTIWAGKEHLMSEKGGLIYFHEGGWEVFPTNTPGGKYISGLMVDSQGRLWCGGTARVGKGVYTLENGEWTNYTAQDSAYDVYFYNRPQGQGEGPQTFVEHSNGEVWAGSFGSGIAVFLLNGEQIYFAAQDSLSYGNVSRVYGIGGSPDFPVIGEMVLDFYDSIWIINRQSLANKPLLMAPYDFMIEHSPNIMWEEYTTADIGSNTFYYDFIDIDQQGRLWMGGKTSSTGVLCFNFQQTPYDKFDDISVEFTIDDGLRSNTVHDLAVDDDNRIWVVSSGGADYLDIPAQLTSTSGYYFQPNYDLYGKNINCVAVDPMNNKWFGTEEEGVIVLGSDNYTILHVYTKETHPLMDNRILAISFDSYSGKAYIATPEGLSVIQTPYRAFNDELIKLEMGPIPFYPDLGEPLTFSTQSLSTGAVVRIYTHTGLLVRKLSLFEASLGWDGRDTKGRMVGSGIYLVLIVSPEGQSLQGKVPVIRR